MYFVETSLGELYQNVVNGFRTTTKRQHAIDPIVIKELTWTPFLGMKTLFIKALADNTHENTEYYPMILFKKVNYKPTEKSISITANDGKLYRLEQLSIENTNVLVRCSCGDFRWRFKYADQLDKTLYGSKGKKYESMGLRPPVNPQQIPGVCKHLIKTTKVLKESGLLL